MALILVTQSQSIALSSKSIQSSSVGIKIIMIKFYKPPIHKLLIPKIYPSFSYFHKKQTFFNSINQSMYYKPRVQINDFMNGHGITFRDGDRSVRVKECRFCTKPHYNDLSNMFCLSVDKATGVFHCFRCNTNGSWMDFKKRYLGIDDSSITSILSEDFDERESNEPGQEISEVEFMIYEHNLKGAQFEDVRDYLKSRGFTPQTIAKYKLGAGVTKFMNENGMPEDVHVIYFPMFKINRNRKNAQEEKNSNPHPLDVLINKAKLKGASKQTKKYLRQYPSGPGSGFFGLNTIQTSDTSVVITQGQFDAMAVHQVTGYPAISLPLGATSLPDSILSNLNQFQKIILWMDNDEAGKVGSEKIAHKLGIDRTYIVKNLNSKLKDANDFLLEAPQEIKGLLESSKNKNDENILRFTDLKESVKNRIFKYEQFTGVKVDWLPFFNKKVKGVRMQELTVFSGPTGSGKTTFLSQFSLDLCRKNIPVLWGSFQIRNQVLLANMMHQFSEINLVKNRQKFQYYADMFEKLPLYYLSFHGSTKAEQALDIIEYAIEKHNISVLVIDTLQFFLSGQAEGYGKFDLQDRVLSHLRNIATNYKIHVVVVIHPRKVEQGEDIQLHSIYGSSKATQEADNVWMIQNRDNFRIFDVKKNRFDGEIGKTAIGFDRSSKRFLQLNKNELLHVFNKDMSMQEIVRERKSNQREQQEEFVLERETEEPQMEADILKNPRVPRKKNPYN